MAEMFDEKKIIGVSTAGQSFFGNPANNGSRTVYSPDSKVVEIDIMRGNERIAALIHRGTNSRHLGNLQKNTDTQNFSNFARVYPLAEEIGDITADEILNRNAGENPYEQRSRFTRMREKAIEHYLEHVRRLLRLFEVLSWDSLLNGQHPAILGTTNTDLIYDFRRAATHSITPAIPWDNVNADILGDIDGGCELVRQDGKQTPNFAFFAGDVMDAFIKNTTAQELADNRRFEFIQVGINNPVPAKLQPLVEGGATPRGRLVTPFGYELWVFTYVDDYENATGTRVKYLPSGTVLLGYYGARCDRYFGPPEILPPTAQKAAWFQEMFGFNMMAPPMPPMIKNQGAVVNPAMFYVNAYPSNDDKKVSICTQAAPIYATTQTDAFVKLSGLIAGDES
jgi:hypothetical protein